MFKDTSFIRYSRGRYFSLAPLALFKYNLKRPYPNPRTEQLLADNSSRPWLIIYFNENPFSNAFYCLIQFKCCQSFGIKCLNLPATVFKYLDCQYMKRRKWNWVRYCSSTIRIKQQDRVRLTESDWQRNALHLRSQLNRMQPKYVIEEDIDL